jgi:predicted RNase H-like nuclease (RuvC/YqgF family)
MTNILTNFLSRLPEDKIDCYKSLVLKISELTDNNKKLIFKLKSLRPSLRRKSLSETDKSQLLEFINSFSTKLVNQKADIVLLKSKILVLRKTYAKKNQESIDVVIQKFQD